MSARSDNSKESTAAEPLPPPPHRSAIDGPTPPPTPPPPMLGSQKSKENCGREAEGAPPPPPSSSSHIGNTNLTLDSLRKQLYGTADTPTTPTATSPKTPANNNDLSSAQYRSPFTSSSSAVPRHSGFVAFSDDQQQQQQQRPSLSSSTPLTTTAAPPTVGFLSSPISDALQDGGSSSTDTNTNPNTTNTNGGGHPLSLNVRRMAVSTNHHLSAVQKQQQEAVAAAALAAEKAALYPLPNFSAESIKAIEDRVVKAKADEKEDEDSDDGHNGGSSSAAQSPSPKRVGGGEKGGGGGAPASSDATPPPPLLMRRDTTAVSASPNPNFNSSTTNAPNALGGFKAFGAGAGGGTYEGSVRGMSFVIPYGASSSSASPINQQQQQQQIPNFSGPLATNGSLINKEVQSTIQTLKSLGQLLTSSAAPIVPTTLAGRELAAQLNTNHQANTTNTSKAGSSPTPTSSATISTTTTTTTTTAAAGEMIMAIANNLTRMLEDHMIGFYSYVKAQHDSERSMYGWGAKKMDTRRWDAALQCWVDSSSSSTAATPSASNASSLLLPSPTNEDSNKARTAAKNNNAAFITQQQQQQQHIISSHNGSSSKQKDLSFINTRNARAGQGIGSVVVPAAPPPSDGGRLTKAQQHQTIPPSMPPSSSSPFPSSPATTLASFLYLQLEAIMHLTGATRGAIYLVDKNLPPPALFSSPRRSRADTINNNSSSLLLSRRSTTHSASFSSPVAPAAAPSSFAAIAANALNARDQKHSAVGTFARRVAAIGPRNARILDPSWLAPVAGGSGGNGGNSTTLTPSTSSSFRPVTIPLEFPADVPLAAPSSIATCIQHNVGLNLSNMRYKASMANASSSSSSNSNASATSPISVDASMARANAQRQLNVLEALVLPFGDGTSNQSVAGCIVIADRKRGEGGGRMRGVGPRSPREAGTEAERRGGGMRGEDDAGRKEVVFCSGPYRNTSSGTFDLADEQFAASLCSALEAVVSRYGPAALLSASKETHHQAVAERLEALLQLSAAPAVGTAPTVQTQVGEGSGGEEVSSAAPANAPAPVSTSSSPSSSPAPPPSLPLPSSSGVNRHTNAQAIATIAKQLEAVALVPPTAGLGTTLVVGGGAARTNKNAKMIPQPPSSSTSSSQAVSRSSILKRNVNAPLSSSTQHPKKKKKSITIGSNDLLHNKSNLSTDTDDLDALERQLQRLAQRDDKGAATSEEEDEDEGVNDDDDDGDEVVENGNTSKTKRKQPSSNNLLLPARVAEAIANPPKTIRRTVMLRIQGGGNGGGGASSPFTIPLSSTATTTAETLVVDKDVVASLEEWHKKNGRRAHQTSLLHGPEWEDHRLHEGVVGVVGSDGRLIRDSFAFGSGDGEQNKFIDDKKNINTAAFLSRQSRDDSSSSNGDGRLGDTFAPHETAPSSSSSAPPQKKGLDAARDRATRSERADVDAIMQKLSAIVANANTSAATTNNNNHTTKQQPPAIPLHDRRGSIGISGASKAALANAYPIHVVSKDAFVGEVGELLSSMEVLWLRSLEKVTALQEQLEGNEKKLAAKDDTIQKMEMEIRRLNKLFVEMRSDLSRIRKAVPSHLAEQYGIEESSSSRQQQQQVAAIMMAPASLSSEKKGITANQDGMLAITSAPRRK